MNILTQSVITANALLHFGLDEAATCFCWIIIPRKAGAPAQPDFGLPEGYGKPEGYTSLDRNLLVDGLLFVSAANVLPTQIPSNIGLDIDGVEATLLFPDAAPLLRERVEMRLYDGALAYLFALPWEAFLAGQATSADIVPLLAGRLGGAEFDDNAATFELLPWSALANTNIGRTTSDSCDCARYGRGRCLNLILLDGINITLHGRTIAATVAAPPAGQDVHGMRLWVSPSQARATGWANFGILRLASGSLEGAELPVKSWTVWPSGLVEVLLRVPCPVLPDVGAPLWVEEGCDRSRTMCLKKEPNPDAPTGRGNIWNFQGFDPPGIRSEQVEDAA